MKINPIQATDFYKYGHKSQFPDGTTQIYSNFTPRSNWYAPVVQGEKIDHAVFANLQGFIKWFLIDAFDEHFFGRPKAEVIAEYNRRTDSSLGPNSVDSSHIAELHDLGYLPIEIKALPEGSLVPMKVPFFTITNTRPEAFWLVNYLETVLSNELWKPTNNATVAFAYRKLLDKYAKETGGPLDFVLWQGHDFSMRGMSGMHDAASAGLGHLYSFLGTDTEVAIQYAENYYQGLNTFVGGSVPATEHAVMCAGGKAEERETIRRLINDIYPTGVVSIVSDTWDFWNTINVIAPSLKEEITSRVPNALGLAKVVFRPDSGDPVDVVCGAVIEDAEDIDWAVDILENQVRAETPHGECGEYNPSGLFRIDGKVYKVSCAIEWNRHDKQYYYVDGHYNVESELVELSPQEKGAVEVLWDHFGGTINAAGYKELNPRVGVIYGDSITLDRAERILEGLKQKGFASTNVVFGIGSYTYQYCTRDTFGMAMKATYAVVNGEGRELFKDPVTDSGTKKSAKGLLRVEFENGDFVLYDQQTPEQEKQGLLRTVFKDGVLTIDESIDTIRTRLQKEL